MTKCLTTVYTLVYTVVNKLDNTTKDSDTMTDVMQDYIDNMNQVALVSAIGTCSCCNKAVTSDDNYTMFYDGDLYHNNCIDDTNYPTSADELELEDELA